MCCPRHRSRRARRMHAAGLAFPPLPPKRFSHSGGKDIVGRSSRHTALKRSSRPLLTGSASRSAPPSSPGVPTHRRRSCVSSVFSGPCRVVDPFIRPRTRMAHTPQDPCVGHQRPGDSALAFQPSVGAFQVVGGVTPHSVQCVNHVGDEMCRWGPGHDAFLFFFCYNAPAEGRWCV